METQCAHKCHSGAGLNPWVEECPICHCPNPNYNHEKAAELKEEFIQQMISYGWTDFRESVAIVEANLGIARS